MRKLSIILFGIAIQSSAIAQSGLRDPTFGDNGHFILNPDFNNEQVQGIALTKTNKILVLLNTNVLEPYEHETFLVRFNNNGTEDSSFGDNGVRQVLDDDYSAFGYSIAVDDSNRIILVDQDQEYSNSIRVYRLKANGGEDETFGSFGQVHLLMPNADNALLIQHDGKILVGGSNGVTRINNDGTLDDSFNAASITTFLSLPYAFVLGIAQQTDDKVLITGNSTNALFVVRLNEDGTADSAFGVNGVTVIDSSGNEVGQHITEMPDGEIVVTGYSQTDSISDFYCWKLNANGVADNSFGNNGSSLLFSGPGDNFGFFVFPSADSDVLVIGSIFNSTTNDPVIYHVLNDGSIDTGFGENGVSGKTFTCAKSIEIGSAIDDSGRILIAGTGTFHGNNRLALSRFLPGGQPDETFGVNATTVQTVLDSEYVDKTVYDFSVLPNGKILGAGSAFDLSMFGLNANGTLDSSYGVNGILVPASQRLEEEQSFIACDSTNIYVAENFTKPVFGYQSFNYDFEDNPITGFAIHKFNSDGGVDSTYGVNGIVEPFFPGYNLNSVTDIALQPDNKLVICGLVPLFQWSVNIYVIRLNADGSLDESFGDQGILIFDWAEEDYNLAMNVSSDGKIVLQENLQFDNQSVLRIERLMPDGTPDITFGNDGQDDVILDNMYDWSRSIVSQSDHKLLAMTTRYISVYQYYQYNVLRLNQNGSIDSTFGINGYASLEDAGFIAPPIGLSQSDGKILCFSSSYESGYTLTIARLLNDGSFDATFGSNGISVFDTAGLFIPYAMHLQEDGKIVVAGSVDYDNFYVARLLNDVGIPLQAAEPLSPKLQVYPNPSSDQLIINYPFSSNEEATIIITDVTGKILREEKVNSGSEHYVMKVNDLSSGIYLMTLQSENNSASTKFVKQ